MRFKSLRFVVCLIIIGLSWACNNKKQGDDTDKAVYISHKDGKYLLYRNGQPFYVKGAAGFTNLSRLKKAGGNTIRVWDTTHLARILDSAQANQIAVVAGLPMPPSASMDDFYKTPSAVAHITKLQSFINRFKNHPALLSWCLGNELAFPYKPEFNKFYSVFNDAVDMIHQTDPNHPVTTTIMSFQKQNIINIKLRTNIDFISLNIFGSIQTLSQDLEKFNWFWDGPFMITEWGVEGPWIADNQNAWGAYQENTSTKKAEQYLTIYQKYMPVKNPRFLGEMVFYWGQKQELTPTWFSLFDENGAETEAVHVMQYLWSGKKVADAAPKVKYMLVDGKGGKDNILFKPGVTISSAVYLNDANTNGFAYKWMIYKEDWYKPNGIFNEKKPKPLRNLILKNNSPNITFKMPLEEGPYRISVYVYNQKGSFATANTPFYVLNNP